MDPDSTVHDPCRKRISRFRPCSPLHIGKFSYPPFHLET